MYTGGMSRPVLSSTCFAMPRGPRAASTSGVRHRGKTVADLGERQVRRPQALEQGQPSQRALRVAGQAALAGRGRQQPLREVVAQGPHRDARGIRQSLERVSGGGVHMAYTISHHVHCPYLAGRVPSRYAIAGQDLDEIRPAQHRPDADVRRRRSSSQRYAADMDGTAKRLRHALPRPRG